MRNKLINLICTAFVGSKIVFKANKSEFTLAKEELFRKARNISNHYDVDRAWAAYEAFAIEFREHAGVDEVLFEANDIIVRKEFAVTNLSKVQ